MYTPYDWQEGIGHRAQYVENKLAQGSPVLALSLDEGILILTYRRNVRKIFEIYDRLAYAAVGQQSDVESLRVAAIDFAHQEGFNRSEQDVTVQRVVTALSNPVKKAFADFSSSPFVVRCLFAEVGSKAEDDIYAVLDYDGDFNTRKGYAFVTGSEETGKAIEEKLSALSAERLKLDKARKKLEEIWTSTRGEADDGDEDLKLEVAIIDRSEEREARFRLWESGD